MKKEKVPALDKYIIFCFVILIIYTTVHIIMFVITGGMEMDTIAKLVYAAFGGEVLICALLKKLKLTNAHKKEMKDIELIDIDKEVADDGVVG